MLLSFILGTWIIFSQIRELNAEKARSAFTPSFFVLFRRYLRFTWYQTWSWPWKITFSRWIIAPLAIFMRLSSLLPRRYFISVTRKNCSIHGWSISYPIFRFAGD